MTIEQILDNYERYHNELEADLYFLHLMLEVDLKEVEGSTAELGQILKFFKGCADFVNNEAVDRRLAHAELRFKQLSVLDWLIRSCSQDDQQIIQALWIDRLSLSEAAERFYISKTSMFRRKQEVLSSLETVMRSSKDVQELWNDVKESGTT
jgi:predicted DNA-binding protein YlxM (UPF0122 family)